MALVVKDRTKETTNTTGTGTLTLSGASTGFQAFSVIGDGNTTYYAIVDSANAEWEVGIGTYTLSGTTLSRDTILESSNAGSAVNLQAGTKEVFVTYPAEKSVNTDDIGSTVQAYDADTAKYDDTTANFTGTLQNGGSNVVVDSDIGSTVEAYSATNADYGDATANFTGTLQNGGSNVLVDSDIGVNVQAYDATIVVDADIGVSVQGYDADTAKYDDVTANFTGTLQNGGSNVVVDTDIGSTVEAYNSNLAGINQALTTTSSPTFATLNATTVDLGNWTVTESSGVLYFATGGTNKMKLDASGNLTVVGNVTAYGTV